MQATKMHNVSGGLIFELYLVISSRPHLERYARLMDSGGSNAERVTLLNNSYRVLDDDQTSEIHFSARSTFGRYLSTGTADRLVSYFNSTLTGFPLWDEYPLACCDEALSQ